MNRKTTKAMLLLSVMLAAIILQGCGEAASNTAANKAANAMANAPVSFNTNGVSISNANTTGGETMERDPIEAGRFKCKKDDEITLEFAAPNQNSKINYEFTGENIKGVVANNKLTFTCDKRRKLGLLFTFVGSGGSFGIVFRAKSGAVIDDEEAVTNPLSSIPQTRFYTFLVK